MFEFDKLCREYENLTYEERLDILTDMAGVIVPAIEELKGKRKDFFMLVSAACAADGKLDPEEYSLFNESTGLDLDFDEAAETIRQIRGKDLAEQANELVDRFGELDEDVKAAMVSYCLCICSADKRIGLQERSFIRRLIRE